MEENEIFSDWSLTFDINIWSFTLFALLIYLLLPFTPSFQISFAVGRFSLEK